MWDSACLLQVPGLKMSSILGMYYLLRICRGLCLRWGKYSIMQTEHRAQSGMLSPSVSRLSRVTSSWISFHLRNTSWPWKDSERFLSHWPSGSTTGRQCRPSPFMWSVDFHLCSVIGVILPPSCPSKHASFSSSLWENSCNELGPSKPGRKVLCIKLSSLPCSFPGVTEPQILGCIFGKGIKEKKKKRKYRTLICQYMVTTKHYYSQQPLGHTLSQFMESFSQFFMAHLRQSQYLTLPFIKWLSLNI